MAYVPLNTNQNLIRLLYIAPALDDDIIIHCRLQIALLDDEPEYEALSYVWGDPDDTRAIQVEGQTVQITQNLYSALKHLRLEEQERILWVDAVCIDQSNLLERKHQVSRMRYIYGQASLVVVWLGEGWEGSDLAMEFIQRLGEDDALHLDPSLSPSIEVDGRNLHSVELQQDIIRLFDLPWWKRTWTVQEFVLARKLVFQCSKSVVTQEMMYMARENFWSHKDRCCLASAVYYHHPLLGLTVSGSFVQPARLDFLLKNRHRPFSVLTGIATFCKREVSDPRDRIYGMLGLGTGEYIDLVEPDYALSPEQACEAVVIKSVERTRKLEFLSHIFERNNPKLPSFIPNWTESFAWNEVYENRLGNIDWFSASLDVPAEVELISHGMLTTRGVILDTIMSTCTTPILLSGEDIGSLEEIHRVSGVESHPDGLYPYTGDSRTVALWHTLLGGMEMVLRDSNRFTQRLKGSSDLSKYSKWANFYTKSPCSRGELWDNELSHILLDLETGARDRDFFVTKQGYFGLGPKRCKKDDQVVVLAGGNIPYIVRRVGRGAQLLRIFRILRQGKSFVRVFKALVKLCFCTCYIILGDSYVEGIMDGEVFMALRESGKEMTGVILL